MRKSAAKPPVLSRRTRPFQESVIREMTRIGAEVGGVNLAQGLPDFAPPRELLKALPKIFADPSNHQYSFTWGSPAFRQAVAEKCARFNSLSVDPANEVTITCGVSEAIADEIYEHIWYEEHRHVSLASLPGMEDRTVTVSGLGKTYAVTGWRVGWAVAAAPLTALIRKVHDYVTLCAPSPFQAAGCVALALPDFYYENLRREYAKRRTILLDALLRCGLSFTPPEGSYYVMVDAKPLGWKDDWDLVNFLARKVGVLAVPGSSFYTRRGGGKTRARLNFAKKEETLREAVMRLSAKSLRYEP